VRSPLPVSEECCSCCTTSGESITSQLASDKGRFSLGSFFASIALQVMFAKDPLNYRTPIYTQVRQPHTPVICV
jgi:hypothetical protein